MNAIIKNLFDEKNARSELLQDLPLISEDKKLQQEKEKYTDLQLKLAEIEKQINEYNSKRAELKTQKEKQVAKLLNGESIDDLIQINTSEIKGLRRKQELYSRAILEQAKIVSSLEAEVSREICNKAYPIYKDLIKNVASAIIALIEVQLKEREFYNGLSDEYVHMSTLWTGAYTGINVNEIFRRDCREGFWFRDMIEQGYLTADDIPKIFRGAWGLDDVKTKRNEA